MDLEALKKTLNSDSLPEKKEIEVIKILSKDEKVIPMMMNILNEERIIQNQLRDDMNVELSRAHIYIDEYTESKPEAKKTFSKPFVIDKIAVFYIKYKEYIKHSFNRF